jgi:hypothetical protein
MNNKNSLDKLLRQLTLERLDEECTAHLLTSIETLSPVFLRRRKVRRIVYLSAGAAVAVALLAGGSYWLFEQQWRAVMAEIAAIGKVLAESFEAIGVAFSGVTLSAVALNTFVAGVLLLLIDALIRKHKALNNER